LVRPIQRSTDNKEVKWKDHIVSMAFAHWRHYFSSNSCKLTLPFSL
jgi:hypothetical protein